MNIKPYPPHPALKNYVLGITTIHITLTEGTPDVESPYPPTPFQSLMFYCNDPVSMGRKEGECFDLQPDIIWVGPQISRVNIKVHRQLRAIRVDFLPGGMYRMLGIPMHEMLDLGFDAVDVFGAQMRTINAQLQDNTSLEEGKTIVENFLLQQISKLKEAIPFDDALRTLFLQNGTLSIEKTASLSCLSLKQFERKCKERIGMNPKMYARILKFSKAYRLHEACPHLSWTQIAYEAEYFDQMHMIRDFKMFAGVNPTMIELQLQATPIRMQKDLNF